MTRTIYCQCFAERHNSLYMILESTFLNPTDRQLYFIDQGSLFSLSLTNVMTQPELVAPLPNVSADFTPDDMAVVGDYVYIKFIDGGVSERYTFLDMQCNVNFKNVLRLIQNVHFYDILLENKNVN